MAYISLHRIWTCFFLKVRRGSVVQVKSFGHMNKCGCSLTVALMLTLCIQVRSTIQSKGTCGHLCFTWVCVYGNSFLTICMTAYPDCRRQCDRLALALCPFCYLFVIPSMYLADIVFPPRAPCSHT